MAIKNINHCYNSKDISSYNYHIFCNSGFSDNLYTTTVEIFLDLKHEYIELIVQ